MTDWLTRLLCRLGIQRFCPPPAADPLAGLADAIAESIAQSGGVA